MRQRVKFRVVSILIHGYRWLIRLYPAEFRDEFGEEMLAVFSEALSEVRVKGFRLVVVRFLRELKDYPSSLWREQRQMRRNRKEGAGPQPFFPAYGVAESIQLTRPSGLEVAVAILPFALMGLLFTYKALDYASGQQSISFYWGLSL